ncbi:multicopper oxidase domain-containing protein [Kutzneria buriramensis]|uniref:FtsP/CotA-like multicopper oxidase with cupredoxin domain n=1 Tax=Kutzneria buriramensis TaxID=1045776 RepID=A0A3E0HLV1_9PSEU|nr:multicopper oxidase domain-containing protein [Kutzneria buriramensis]REH47015.1 FtsP/CotA-like multicopper oxidase with cupredoxin domain [Kutzneria buriramensis]
MNVPLAVAARKWYLRRVYSSPWSHLHAYFAADAARVVQSALGLFWLIDGVVQLLPFASTPDGAGLLDGQPQWLTPSLAWVAGLDGPGLALWHALFALVQVGIGLGLLARPTVKVALAGSVGWAAVLWWLGGSFGLLFTGDASPLTGAPGAAALIVVLALLAWPTDRPGGLLGDRGARAVWAALWIGMAWLWLRVSDGGDVIALVCAGASALVGAAVGIRWHARTFLWTAIGLNLAYWFVGQGFGGLVAGEGIDAGSGPLFIVLAGLLFTLFPLPATESSTVAAGKPALTQAELSRRTVLTSVGVAGALAAIAVVADVAGAFGRGGGAGGPFGGPLLGTHKKDTHGDGGHSNDNNGGGSALSGKDPNSGIQTLTSQAPMPPQFKATLPIPQQLKPTRQTGDTDYYEIVQSAATAEILPGLKTPIWGYNGTFPGPTIVQNPNRNVVVTHHNNLPVPTVVHLHGGAVPHDSDGYPTDFVLPAASYGDFSTMPAMGDMPAMSDPDAVTSRQTRDYSYPEQPRAATLWYHDHRMDFTGASVYRGLAGFHIAHDAEEQALPLPQGARDVPLMIADRAFAADGSFLYPALDPTMRSTPGVDKDSGNGVMGDVILVNGAPWPVFQVDTARYRFRILNASNARTYQLALDDSSGFVQIGTDQGLLAAPQTLDSIAISPAQRFDVVIDFSKHKVGDQITLTNQLGDGSTAVVMRFQVARTATDTSSVPATLSKVEAITPGSSAQARTMKFHRAGTDWEINGRIFDPSYSEADVRGGSTEVWTVTSDFHHPFHVHNCAMQVVSRDGQAPGPYDQGFKDTVFLNKGEKVQIAIRFSDYKGRYVFHCHNLEHEDMGMMANFTIN